jgi:hypothetical protein
MKAFRLCERWMARQTFMASTWIVVDDGDTETPPRMGQHYIRRESSQKRMTLAENILAAIPIFRTEYLIFIEDDDWYAASYVERVLALFRKADLVGLRNARYYHLGVPGGNVCCNAEHASLAGTAMRRVVLSRLVDSCHRSIKSDDPYVDLFLWGVKGSLLPFKKQLLDSQATLSVGIKGVPGRAGVTEGHRPEQYQKCVDPEYRILRTWIGEEDAQVYVDWIRGKNAKRSNS